MTTAPHDPPFRAEHIGSLLRPPELLHARTAYEAGRLSLHELREVENRCIRQAVAWQEEIGLQVITDGEYRRGVFYTDFVCRGLGGASVYYESERMFFVDEEGNKIPVPLIRIHDRLRWRAPIHVDDFLFVRSLTSRLVKITIPSPTIPYSVTGENVSKAAYPDLELLRADIIDAYRKELQALATAGCRYVQLDEVPLALHCDLQRWERLRQHGIDPRKVVFEIFPQLINDALAARPSALHVGMHLCRGNNQSGWISEGGYDPIAEMLFNEIHVDSYFLEYDTPRAGTFAPLRFVPKHKTVVLGLVSSKVPQLESKDDLKRRLDEAATYVDLDRLALSPQCGFASTAPGNKLTPEQQAAKLRLVVEVAREVWG